MTIAMIFYLIFHAQLFSSLQEIGQGTIKDFIRLVRVPKNSFWYINKLRAIYIVFKCLSELNSSITYLQKKFKKMMEKINAFLINYCKIYY